VYYSNDAVTAAVAAVVVEEQQRHECSHHHHHHHCHVWATTFQKNTGNMNGKSNPISTQNT